MRKYSFWPLFLVAAGLAMPCHAETLDDDLIRQIYAEAKAAARDPAKSHDIMETRLDDNFTLRSNMTRAVGDAPPRSATETKSKQQAIDAMVEGMQELKIESYDNEITSIKYSDDRKSAYVTDTSSSSGQVNVPQQPGQNGPIRYSAKESCADTLSLVGDMIKIMQSDCNDQVVIGK